MATKTAKAKTGKGGFVRDPEGKAIRAKIGQMVPLTVFERITGSGKAGFSGQMMDASTGKKYQVIMAVEIAS